MKENFHCLILKSCSRRSGESFRKLAPQHVIKNPVMFVVEIGSVLTTLILLRDLVAPTPGSQPLWFTVTVSFLAVVHGRVRQLRRGGGRGARQGPGSDFAENAPGNHRAALTQRQGEETVPASALRKGDIVVVEAGEVIPGDGDVIEGIASVDESAITGESAPVIRESGGDRSAVTGGTKVLSDRIVVRITASPGESFLDRMIALVEGAERQKTPNEIALNILARRSHSGVSVRLRDSRADGALLRHCRCLRHRDRRVAGVFDPDDDRRTALGYRHRGHGPLAAGRTFWR